MDYHSRRWQSARTLALFQKLNHDIPGDKALLGFKDFSIQQTEAKLAHCRPEYAWYLDRPVVKAQRVEDIQTQAAGGRFSYYFIPDCDQPYPIAYADRVRLRRLTMQELVEQMKAADARGEMQTAGVLRFEYWERYRMALISQLKQLYAYEYFEEDPADQCYRGNVPCYLFDLSKPLTGSEPVGR